MENKDRPPLAMRLRQLRESKGLTQKQAAEIIGVKQSTYNTYETGRQEPKLETLLLISEVFEKPVTWLAFGLSGFDDIHVNDIIRFLNDGKLNGLDRMIWLLRRFKLLDDEWERDPIDSTADYEVDVDIRITYGIYAGSTRDAEIVVGDYLTSLWNTLEKCGYKNTPVDAALQRPTVNVRKTS
jgi:transcriptional regulator with XRE-family HTH domain